MDEGEAAAGAKDALRHRMLAVRAALPPARRAEASAAVRARLAALPELAGARAVLGYAALPAEVDVDDLLRDLASAGVRVHLPWVDGDQLGVAAVVDLVADVVPGWHGVREPAPALRRPVAARSLDVVVAPGVAFDAGGGRLGYGGGHFDRLLARLGPGATVVGAAFDEQIVDLVPVTATDRRVDVVVTPSRVLRR